MDFVFQLKFVAIVSFVVPLKIMMLCAFNFTLFFFRLTSRLVIAGDSRFIH